LAAVAATAALCRRFPRAVVPAALAALPFRVPLEVGGESVKLLLPLYLVIAGAVVAYAYGAWRADAEPGRAPKLLDVAFSGFLVLYALQGAYSGDVSVASQNAAFFYAPFALLYGIVAANRWDAAQLRACALILAGLALLLVGAGFVEYARGEYLIRPGGIKPNDFDPYFRIQSLFFDPNIFGRFVALVMVMVAAVMIFTGKSRRVLGSALVLAALLAGLVLTLSQSSFAALLAGLVALAAMRWNARWVLGAAGAAALAGMIFVLAAPSVSGVDLTDSRSAEASTSGRFDLITGGVTLWSERPLWGYGSGSFADAFDRRRLARESAFGSPTTTKSHTAPLTVAAEQGLIGFAAYTALLAAAFAAVFRRVRVDRRPGTVARVAVAAAFTALFVHSLIYAAFLEDPLTWVMAGIAVSLAAIGSGAPGGPDAPGEPNAQSAPGDLGGSRGPGDAAKAAS
ncbi:MAG: O-antigen ligase family protein, partial [Solirubrobacterales bacterium]